MARATRFQHDDRPAVRPAPRGFTLIELLVAVAVFAIMAAIAYGGLTTVLDARRHTQQVAERLADMQFAVSLFASDLQQAVPRPVRGSRGDRLPPFDGQRHRVAFTRAGHANPTGLKRSTLQRVAWSLEAGELTRWAWRVLDRARGTTPRRRVVLDQVRLLRLRYFDSGTWYDTWPPRPTRGGPSVAPALRWPEGVEFTLILENGTEITRAVPLVSAPRTAPVTP